MPDPRTDTFSLASRRVVGFGVVYAVVVAIFDVVVLAGHAAVGGGPGGAGNLPTQAFILFFGTIAGFLGDSSRWDPDVLRDIDRRRGETADAGSTERD